MQTFRKNIRRQVEDEDEHESKLEKECVQIELNYLRKKIAEFEKYNV